MEQHFLSLEFQAADIPRAGVEGRLVADAAQRTAIADALDLLSLDALSFDYRLRRGGGNRFRLNGRLEAVVTQECVVTLEPLKNSLSEEVEIEFWPPGDIERLERAEPSADAVIDLDGPEPLEDEAIDIGRIVYETLAAAIDLYPRKPGASFDMESAPAGAEEAAESPFSVLRSLKPADR